MFLDIKKFTSSGFVFQPGVLNLYEVDFTVSGFEANSLVSSSQIAVSSYTVKISFDSLSLTNFSKLKILLVDPSGNGSLILANNGSNASVSVTNLSLVPYGVYTNSYDNSFYNQVNLGVTPTIQSDTTYYSYVPIGSLNTAFPTVSEQPPFFNGITLNDVPANGTYKLYFWDTVGTISGSVGSITLNLQAQKIDNVITLSNPNSSQYDIVKKNQVFTLTPNPFTLNYNSDSDVYIEELQVIQTESSPTNSYNLLLVSPDNIACLLYSSGVSRQDSIFNLNFCDNINLSAPELLSSNAYFPCGTYGSNFNFSSQFVFPNNENIQPPYAQTLSVFKGSKLNGDWKFYVQSNSLASGGLKFQINALPANTTTFVPTSISGCLLWLDSLDLQTLWKDTSRTLPVKQVGDSIASWADKSGNSNHAIQATAANTPQLFFNEQKGKTFVKFQETFAVDVSQSNKYLRTPSISFTNTMTVFIVVEYTGDLPLAGSTSPFNSVCAGGLSIGWNGSYFKFNGATASQIEVLPIENYRIYQMTYNTTSSSLKEDGENIYLSSSNVDANSSGPSAGVLDVGSGLIGRIGEVLIYNSVLSDTDTFSVIDYLKAKWYGSQTFIPSFTTTTTTTTTSTTTTSTTTTTTTTPVPSNYFLNVNAQTELAIAGATFFIVGEVYGGVDGYVQRFLHSINQPDYSNQYISLAYNMWKSSTQNDGNLFFRSGTNHAVLDYTYGVFQSKSISPDGSAFVFSGTMSNTPESYWNGLEYTQSPTWCDEGYYQGQFVVGDSISISNLGIREILVFSNQLTQPEINLVNNWLTKKYVNVGNYIDFDPNDLSGNLKLWLQANSSYVYSDINKTTPVNNGGTVAVWENLATQTGSDWDATQSISNYRPRFYSEVSTGKNVVVFGSEVIPNLPTPPSPFLPTSISGCILWLDGLDTTTLFKDTSGNFPIGSDGDVIGLWEDKSSNNYSFVSISDSKKPVYKVGYGVNFYQLGSSRTQNYLYSTTNVQKTKTYATVYVVAYSGQPNNPLNMNVMSSNGLNFGTVNNYLAFSTQTLGSNNLQATASQPFSESVSYSPANIVYSFVIDSDQSRLFRNLDSVSLSSNDAGVNILNGVLYLGAQIGAADGFWKGTISEIIVYDAILNSTQNQSVMQYLLSKYTSITVTPTTSTTTTESPFVDPRLANLKLWFDAADIYTTYTNSSATTIAHSDGDKVGLLKDKSNFKYDAINDNNNTKPSILNDTYSGLNTLSFDSNYFNFLNTKEVTAIYPFVVFVAYRNQPGENKTIQLLARTQNDNSFNVGNFWSGTLSNYIFGTDIDSKEVISSKFQSDGMNVLAFIYNPDQSYCWINGYQCVVKYFANNASSLPVGIVRQIINLGCKVNGYLPSSENSFSGALGEMLLYEGLITERDFQGIYNYLLNKWKLSYTTTSSTTPSVNPSSISNRLKFWVDAADGSTMLNSDGEPVSNTDSIEMWKDKSGGGIDVQQLTSNFQPTFFGGQKNDLPMVYFDGNDSLTSNNILNVFQPSTFFSVVSYEGQPTTTPYPFPPPTTTPVGSFNFFSVPWTFE